jgi:long-subunit fatty acid transport protein
MGCCNKVAACSFFERIRESNWFGYVFVLVFIAAIAFLIAFTSIAVSSIFPFHRIKANVFNAFKLDREIAFIDEAGDHKGAISFRPAMFKRVDDNVLSLVVDLSVDRKKPVAYPLSVGLFDEQHNRIAQTTILAESFFTTQFVDTLRAGETVSLPAGMDIKRIKYFTFRFVDDIKK